MISLYCSLNLLFNKINRPSVVLHLSCPAWVNVSSNCRLLLPSHFYYCYYFHLWHVIGFENIVYLQSEVFMSLYLSSAYQLNVGCFIRGSHIFGPPFCVPSCLVLFSAPAASIAYTSHLAASVTVCAPASVFFVCWVAIFCICIISGSIFHNWLCLPISDFHSWHHVVFLSIVS